MNHTTGPSVRNGRSDHFGAANRTDWMAVIIGRLLLPNARENLRNSKEGRVLAGKICQPRPGPSREAPFCRETTGIGEPPDAGNLMTESGPLSSRHRSPATINGLNGAPRSLRPAALHQDPAADRHRPLFGRHSARGYPLVKDAGGAVSTRPGQNRPPCRVGPAGAQSRQPPNARVMSTPVV